ncbi:MAG: alpha/beta hydrolase [Gammaproteobacteria bacterium]|nr:alpha/beta hydrolase [Gammaproteobacteria bacterium]
MKRALLLSVLIQGLTVLSGARAADTVHETHVHSEIAGVPADMKSLDVYAGGRSQSAPVVVFIHGGGWVSGNKGNVRRSPPFLEFFEKQDMVLVSAGMRLVHNPESPSTTFREQATDVAAAVRWVHDNIQRYGGDPDRLVLLGFSAGAHLVALVGTDDSYLKNENLTLSVLRGVIALDVSAYDIPRAIREAPSQGVPVSPAYLTRVFSSDRNAQEAASPVYHVEPGKQYPPFLVIYGGIFDTSPEGVFKQTLSKVQSEAFAERLRTAGSHAQVYGEPEKTHRSVIRDFGRPGDEITRTTRAFLKDITGSK